jgi:hypothetical protein
MIIWLEYPHFLKNIVIGLLWVGFSGTSISSTYKIDRHDINEILLKVALSTIKPTKQYSYNRSNIE